MPEEPALPAADRDAVETADTAVTVAVPERAMRGGLGLIVGIAAAVITIAGVRSASNLIASVLLSVVLTVAVLPVGRWALRHGWPRWAAATATIAAAYAILLVVIGGVALSIAQLVATLPKYGPRVSDIVDSALKQLADWGVDTESAKTALTKFDIGKLVRVLQTVLSGVLASLATLFFVVALLLFMTADGLGLSLRGRQLRALNPRAAYVLTDFARGTQRYLVVSAVFGAIVAVLDSAALWMIGVPLALTWGLLSFLTNFIPNIGFVLGVIPPALLALLDQGWHGMLAVLVVYSALNVVIQTFIQPRFVGDSVGLSATATFLALAFWGFVLGPLGALLAIPATLLVRSVFLDGRPAEGWVMTIVGTGKPRP